MNAPLNTGVWIRALVISLLLATLALAFGLGAPAPVHLVILVDDSASMPRQAADLAWERLRPGLADLPAGSRVSLIRFAADALVEIQAPADDAEAFPAGLPRTRPLDAGTTDLARAIDRAAAETGAGPAPLLLLVSDGGWREPDIEPGPRILWWDPTRDRAWPDARVEALALTTAATGEQQALVSVAAESAGTIALTLMRDDKVLARRQVQIGGSGQASVSIPVATPAPGTDALVARVTLDEDSRPANDSLGIPIRVPGAPTVLLVAPQPDASAVARALESGGWSVRTTTPAAFDAGTLSGARVLILEQLTPAMLRAPDWQAIASAVSGGDTGLLLLGGPGTFATGGYRHSVLEGLLPVTAESPERRRSARVIYGLDKSGSMAQPVRDGRSRLDLALEAVIGSARSLDPRDQAALLVFDAETRTLLAPGARSDQAAAVRAAWNEAPGGGTSLAPLVERVLGLTSTSIPAADRDQCILVLVSDGQITDADRAEPLGETLAAAGCVPLVLAVGDAGDAAPLRALAQAAGGRFHQVSELPALPVLMQAEVRGLRNPVEPGPVRPLPGEPMPFADPPAGPWPELLAYPLTTARGDARVHLESPLGDPLMVSGWAGAGPVLVLPAGLGAWAPDWPGWTGWERLLAGSLGWLAGGTGEVAGWIRPRPGGGYLLELEIEVDEADPPAPARVIEAASLRLVDPLGRRLTLDARPRSIGRFEVALPEAPLGRYRGVLEVPASPRLDFWYRPEPELRSPGTERSVPEFIRPWIPTPGSGDLGLPLPRETGRLSPLWILAALALFIALLVHERLGLGRKLRRHPQSQGSW